MKKRIPPVLITVLLTGGWLGQTRVEGDLKVGDMAPDFSLEPRGGGPRLSLSSFRGKSPVALVFGSYT
jgi:hypothetical protein